MVRPARMRVALALSATATLLGAAPAAGAAAQIGAARARAILSSKQLWATIDVCNASDQPNTLGVRGSMPGDGDARDHMYMSFRLQYMPPAGKRWVDLASSVHAGFVAVGGGSSARQDGSSFQITPVAGHAAFQLRGVVDFQWRRGHAVLLAVSRATSAGHVSLAGADPAGFSAATCSIG
jgi:hypothetical protein